MLYLTMIIFIISLLMTAMLIFFSKKTFNDREKNSPFECGFDPKNTARLPFSLHFFLIAIIFIIFDVELTLLLPMILTTKTSSFMSLSFALIIFIWILLYGIYHETSLGALNWTI
uniref:NADH-ubiquinone oxidoreductase chain 3 n=1 Tax=Hylastes attenuatus TaxID=471226 RepID=A0A343A6J0_9CUCU|nr:NADH dehydrogenase subunit 3 [Hylastes attenuatus]AOY40182.1 NADH dehydrogenase subunit 3 [Hylastes attenuatus]